MNIKRCDGCGEKIAMVYHKDGGSVAINAERVDPVVTFRNEYDARVHTLHVCKESVGT